MLVKKISLKASSTPIFLCSVLLNLVVNICACWLAYMFWKLFAFILELWKRTSLFRSPTEIRALENYLVEDDMIEHVLYCFATGFVINFDFLLPAP